MDNNYKTKLWKKVICIFLSIIIALGTFVTMTFGNILLSDKIDFRNLITAEAATQDVKYYRYNELVGLYKTDHTDTESIQYKIGEDGEWKNYSVPFSIPAFQTTTIYARLGETGNTVYQDFSTTSRAIGVYTETNTDFDFSYNNVTFDYLRIYNSADKKWFDSINSYVNISGNFAQIIMPDNTLYNFVKTEENTFTDELYGYTLEKQSNKYVLLLNNYYYIFSLSSGKYYLSEIKDNYNNKLELNREITLADFTISDQIGRSFSMDEYYEIWDGFSFNRDITDPNGNVLNYLMDGDTWDYITVTDQAGIYLGQYEYTDGKLTKSNDKSISYYDNGRLKQITYDNGSWIKYTYDDANMTYTTLTSSGETTKTVYNDAFLPIEYTDESRETTKYTYDNHYRVLTETCGTETTAYTYDAEGNLVSYVTGDSESNTYYTYDSNKRIVREQTGNDYTYYTYDSKGNNLVYATLKEDYTGTVPALYDLSLTCFDTTTYTYDSNGRVTSGVYSTGGSVSYEYDNRGNVTKETTVTVENGESTTKIVNYTYDSLGNLLTSSTGNDTSSYIYDAAGRTLLENNNGNCTRTIYDNQGRIIQEIAPEDYDSTKDGLPTANTYADANVGHRYVYNEKTGNLDIETNRLGIVTTYTYYSTGEKETETFDIYEYNYNVKGNLTKVYIDGVNTLTYNYDKDYNLTSEVYANGQSIRYEYDNNGNLARQYHNNDTLAYVTYSYNSDNELTQKINSDTGLKYIYSEDNNVSVYKISDNTLVHSYTEAETEADEENDVEAETDVTETHFGATYSSITKDCSTSYTNDNNIVEYSYTQNDNAVDSDTVKYNNSNVLNANYTYDNFGNITKKDYGNSKSVANTYDTNYRITSTTYNSRTYNYTYDVNSQLTAVNGTNYSASYVYDNRGNITNKTVNGTSTTFDYSNDGWHDRLTSVNGTKLTYDANGNVLTYGDKSFTWSSGRNLSSITDGDNIYTYTYDETGIRTSKTINGVTTRYNTKDGIILSQTDGTNTMYFQYNKIGIPLGFILNNTQYFYMTNQMGDVIAITDTAGTIVGNYEYDEWGNTLNASSNDITSINPLRYRGYYYDNESGYYYLQSRYYDTNICRFINSDDISYVDKNAKLSTNIYSYCMNNSVNAVDPDGHFIILIILLIRAISITNLISKYNSSTYFEAGNKTSGKGYIRINIEKNGFYKDIYEACKIDASTTYGTLASYAEKRFYQKTGRNIYFTKDCMKNEIQLHVDAFFWYKSLRDYINPNKFMSCPAIIYGGAWIQKEKGQKTRDKIYNSTRVIDILESEVFSYQAIAFDYYYGIRSDYKGKKTDPYYKMNYSTFLKKSMK